MTHIVKENIHIDSISVSERLLALRKEKLRLDQRTFAGLVGISQSVLSKWERGEYRPPPLALMKIGDISVDDKHWWYEQAGPEFAARLKAAEEESSSTEYVPSAGGTLNRDLLVYVIEALDLELKKRKRQLPIQKYAELVVLFYEFCQESGRRDSSIVGRLLKIA
jgi:transcriptional regulator with XRE-family HTH domain